MGADYRAFCPMCGVGVGFDEDGCCTGCGSTVCSMNEMRARLQVVDLHVVGALDKGVLDAGNLVLDSSLRRIADENGGCLADWARAELARREAKRDG